jgi:hypothetical protein
MGMSFFEGVKNILWNCSDGNKAKYEREEYFDIIAVDSIPLEESKCCHVYVVHKGSSGEGPDVHDQDFFPSVTAGIVKPSQRAVGVAEGKGRSDDGSEHVGEVSRPHEGGKETLSSG